MTTVATEAPGPSSAYRLPAGDVVAALGTDARRGLTDEEASARLVEYGANELTASKPVPAWRRFLAQFKDVLVILLLDRHSHLRGDLGRGTRRRAAVRGTSRSVPSCS